MVQMNKDGNLDLRTVITPPKPVHCSVSECEMYEVRFEVLARRGPGGSTIRMYVLRSIDGGNTWEPVRFRRNWRRDWWAIFWKGLGGSSWPPGDDFKDAYIKDGKLTICYSNLYEIGPKGQAYAWEMQYDTKADQWDIALLKELTVSENGSSSN